MPGFPLPHDVATNSITARRRLIRAGCRRARDRATSSTPTGIWMRFCVKTRDFR